MKKTTMSSVRCAVSAAVCLWLVACDNTTISETIGMNREAPDEFTVVSRPPLSLPPEFTLRPPRPGEPPRGIAADEQARGLLIGQEVKPKETVDTIVEPKVETAVTPVLSSETPSGAAESFLRRAGVEKAREGIREQLGKDATAPVDTSKASSLVEKLGLEEKSEPVVDAKKEAERLRDNKDKGKAATEGEVQVEKPKSPSLLDKLF